MSTVQDLLMLAEADKPKFNPAEGFATGYVGGVIANAERKRQQEAINTGYSRMQRLLNGEDTDYQNQYKIRMKGDPTTGEITSSIVELSDDERFARDVQTGQLTEQQLRIKYPLYQDAIDKIKIAAQGTAIPSFTGTAVPSAAAGSLEGSPIQPATSGNTASTVAGSATAIPSEDKRRLLVEDYDELGRPKGATDLNALERKQEAKKIAETKAEVLKGKLVNTNNLNLLAGVMRDFSQVYKDSYEEGGAGGFIQSGFSKAANFIGDLPGGTEVGGRFSASGALEGKRIEILLKMMPMLSQQATKPEGSVRIITSVLEALGKTIPDSTTAPRTAARQMEESLRTFYRFARAAEQLGASLDQVFDGRDLEGLSKEEIKSWAKSVATSIPDIVIEGEEAEVLDSFIGTAIKPIRDVVPVRSEDAPARTGAPSSEGDTEYQQYLQLIGQ